MTNPPNDQSGGINANAQGDLNIGADAVGRDKIVQNQNTFNNFIVTLQQWGSLVQTLVEEDLRNVPAVNDAPTADWDDTMNAVLYDIARCENESTAFTTEVNIRMNVWAEVLTLLTNQDGAITTQSNRACVVFDAMGRDLEIYSDKISTLIPQFHQLWDRYFACHWRVLRGWGPPFRREQLVEFRQSIVGSLEVLETRRKTQEGVLMADTRLLKMAQDVMRPGSWTVTKNKIHCSDKERHDGLTSQIRSRVQSPGGVGSPDRRQDRRRSLSRVSAQARPVLEVEGAVCA